MAAMNESFTELRNEIAEAKAQSAAVAAAKPPEKSYPQYSREQQINALARTIYGEGRGDGGEEGMKRSLDSIIARSGNNRDNFIGVVSEPYAYSCWNGMKPSDWDPKSFMVKDHSQSKESPELWAKAKELAAQAYDGGYKPSHSYTHYVTDELFQSTKDDKSKWYHDHEGVLDGKHRYFTNKVINGQENYSIPNRLTSEQVADTTLLSPKEKMVAKSAKTATPKSTATPKAQQPKAQQPKAQQPKIQSNVQPPKTTAVQPKARSTAPTTTASSYVVKKGDNLTNIAKANNTTVANLQKLNPSLSDPNKIGVGQSIKVR